MNTRFRARASLIDRLVDLHPESGVEKKPLRTLDKEGLKESVFRNLSWFFNTRTPITGSAYDKEDLTVIDYGIPDFGSYYTENPEVWDILSKRLDRAISVFEPRLTKVQVTVSPDSSDEKSLQAIIKGEIIVDEETRMTVSLISILDKDCKLRIYENKE